MLGIVTFINSVFDSNSYLIYSEESKECCLIDCGDISPISDYIAQQGLMLKAVFLTHTHFDHIYGLNDLVKHIPDVLVYTSEFGKSALLSDKLNLSRYNDRSFVFLHAERIKILLEGECISLWKNMPVEVFSTPGHDKSCLTYKIGENVFSGDSFIPGIKVVASFPNSDRTATRYFEECIRNMSAGCNLYPGHGPYYTSSDN